MCHCISAIHRKWLCLEQRSQKLYTACSWTCDLLRFPINASHYTSKSFRWLALTQHQKSHQAMTHTCRMRNRLWSRSMPQPLSTAATSLYCILRSSICTEIFTYLDSSMADFFVEVGDPRNSQRHQPRDSQLPRPLNSQGPITDHVTTIFNYRGIWTEKAVCFLQRIVIQ